MKKHIFPALAILAGILLTFAFVACEQPEAEVVEVNVPTLPPGNVLGIFGSLTADGAGIPALTAIDFRLNTKHPDYAGNYFAWKAGSGDRIGDYYDIETGASAKYTTDAFSSDTVTILSGGNARAQAAATYFNALSNPPTDLPGRTRLSTPLRGLILYPVSNWQTFVNDGFHLVKNGDGSFEIRYIHSNAGNIIVVPANGKIDVDASCYNVPAVLVSGAVAEVYRKGGTDGTGGAADVDWNKVKAVGVAAGWTVSSGYNGTLTVTLY